jgi:hypothetical protein
MILHKLIFFRLPYRWAAYGDRPGLDGSDAKSLNEDDERGNDTDRLEREVSSYPGFKSTARLETLFTSRRLPRSYLVLLESLLNVSPAARPTCEKVLAALHLGKVSRVPLIIRSVSPASHELTTHRFSQFNPIPPKSSLSDALAPRTGRASDAASTSSLIPALRGPTTTTTSPPSSPPLPQLPSLPSTSPAATEQQQPAKSKSGEKSRSRSRSRSPQWSRSGWRGWFVPPQWATAQVLRASKSGVLALKIASLCFNSRALPLWALSMLVGLSIVDSLSDNVALNLGLGVVHVVALEAFTWSR